MIGFKVLTKDGLKGPFKKSSILKAITAAQIPLQARLLDLETGRYLSAAELVGEDVDRGRPKPSTEQAPSQDAKPAKPSDITSISDYVIDDKLKLDEESGSKE
jgi:hypothetical protein